MLSDCRSASGLANYKAWQVVGASCELVRHNWLQEPPWSTKIIARAPNSDSYIATCNILWSHLAIIRQKQVPSVQRLYLFRNRKKLLEEMFHYYHLPSSLLRGSAKQLCRVRGSTVFSDMTFTQLFNKNRFHLYNVMYLFRNRKKLLEKCFITIALITIEGIGETAWVRGRQCLATWRLHGWSMPIIFEPFQHWHWLALVCGDPKKRNPMRFKFKLHLSLRCTIQWAWELVSRNYLQLHDDTIKWSHWKVQP